MNPLASVIAVSSGTLWLTFLVLAALYFCWAGAVLITERQVGIVIKRFGGRSLAPGCLIALDGEAGYQADILAPGLHLGLWR